MVEETEGGQPMTRIEELKRRIELKEQLIRLTQDEIMELQKQLIMEEFQEECPSMQA
jgi:hypothetical protein